MGESMWKIIKLHEELSGNGESMWKSQTGGLVRWENHGTFCVGYTLLVTVSFGCAVCQ
jgi:hypothetical protein